MLPQARDSDEYNQDNSGNFEEIDVEFLNGHPGVPNAVWFNSYHRWVLTLPSPTEHGLTSCTPSAAHF